LGRITEKEGRESENANEGDTFLFLSGRQKLAVEGRIFFETFCESPWCVEMFPICEETDSGSA
jgi:hypothetical protein